MPSRRSLQSGHLLREASLTLTQADLGQLADGGAAGAAMGVRLGVHACEELIGQRNHHLGHTGSIPGVTTASKWSFRYCFAESGFDSQTIALATKRHSAERAEIAGERGT
jgi:hypothetical protein